MVVTSLEKNKRDTQRQLQSPLGPHGFHTERVTLEIQHVTTCKNAFWKIKIQLRKRHRVTGGAEPSPRETTRSAERRTPHGRQGQLRSLPLSRGTNRFPANAPTVSFPLQRPRSGGQRRPPLGGRQRPHGLYRQTAFPNERKTQEPAAARRHRAPAGATHRCSLRGRYAPLPAPPARCGPQASPLPGSRRALAEQTGRPAGRRPGWAVTEGTRPPAAAHGSRSAAPRVPAARARVGGRRRQRPRGRVGRRAAWPWRRRRLGRRRAGGGGARDPGQVKGAAGLSGDRAGLLRRAAGGSSRSRREEPPAGRGSPPPHPPPGGRQPRAVVWGGLRAAALSAVGEVQDEPSRPSAAPAALVPGRQLGAAS